MDNSQPKNVMGKFTKKYAQKLFATSTLIGLIIIFSFLSPYFLTFDNAKTILLSTCVTGILAIGITFVIITGAFDLSIGTGMTFCAVIMGVAISKLGLPVWLGLLILIATGVLVGIINGTLIAKFNIPPFVATMGTMMATRGLSLVITGAFPIYFTEDPIIIKITTGSILGNIIPGFNIPNGVLVLAFAAIIASVLLNNTILGRYNFAIGSNEEAIRLSGVNTKKWKIIIFALCGAFSALAGLIMVGRINSVQPALGVGYEMDAIAAVVIGGTSLRGGEGSISGSIIGAFVMQVLLNGLRVMGVSNEWQTVASGVVLVFAVYLDQLRRNKMSVN